MSEEKEVPPPGAATPGQRNHQAETIAIAFHDAYEALAPEYGYRTREASAKPWDEIPVANAGLMVATVERLLERSVIAAAAPAAPLSPLVQARQLDAALVGLRQILALATDSHSDYGDIELAAGDVLMEVGEIGSEAVPAAPQDAAYPRQDGDFAIIGPDCFAMPDGSVLCWRGVNYVPQELLDKATRDHADVGLPGEVDRANANRVAGELEPLS
jgi:hypothetical protein